MRNLLENIGIYAIRKFLAYIVKKYNLSNYMEAITHVGDKIEEVEDEKKK